MNNRITATSNQMCRQTNLFTSTGSGLPAANMYDFGIRIQWLA